MVAAKKVSAAFKFDEIRAEAEKKFTAPFVLEIDAENTVEIPFLTAAKAIEFEERAVGAKAQLEVLCGDEFAKIWALVENEDLALLRAVIDAIWEHFNSKTDGLPGKS